MPPKEPSDTSKSSLLSRFSLRKKAEPPAAPVSDIPEIPRFKLERKLGEGGMASVYLANQESTGRPVAIKIMAKHLQSDPRWADRFLDEARRLAELSHPNIVPVFDWGTHAGIGYIVMEFMKGGDLTNRLRTKRITIREALDITRQVASGLDFAGEKGYVHRDIKPDNILFREDGSPCILDFGIAKESSSSTTISSQGIAIGTGAYMSPEQAQPAGRQLDPRSDLYSLGVVLYEMLADARPFDYRHFDAMQAFQLYIFAHVNSPVPPLPGHLAPFQPVIDQLLAKNPDERFRRGNDLRHALTLLEAQLSGELLDKTLRKIEEPTLILPSTPSAPPAVPSRPPSSAAVTIQRTQPNVSSPSSTGGDRAPASATSSSAASTTNGSIKKNTSVIPLVATALAISGTASYFAYEFLGKPSGKDGLPENTNTAQVSEASIAAPESTIGDKPQTSAKIQTITSEIESLASSPVDAIEQHVRLMADYDALLILEPDNKVAQQAKSALLSNHANYTADLIQNKRLDEAKKQIDLLQNWKSPLATALKQQLSSADEAEKKAAKDVAEAQRKAAMDAAKAIEAQKQKALADERARAIAVEKQKALELENQQKQEAARIAEEKRKALAEAEKQKALQQKAEQAALQEKLRQEAIEKQKQLAAEQARNAELEKQRIAQEKAQQLALEKQKAEEQRQAELAKQAEAARQAELEKQKEQARLLALERQKAEQEQQAKLAKQAEEERKAAEMKSKARSYSSF